MSELARQLWQARRDGTIVRLGDIAEPASTEAAYAVQAEIRACRGAVRGFKVGSTSAEAQRMLGTTEPSSAPVLAPYLHDSPADVAIVPLNMPAVEGEFAFRLGRALPPRPGTYAASEVADAIDAVAGAIEIVGTRIAGGLAGKGRFLMTADGGANVALILGPWTAAWRGLDLKTHRVAVHINGEARGSGEGARALGDPMAVMVWLANQQSRFGRGLEAGDIVSTGTCTGLDRVHPGDRVVADFGTLGSVEIMVR
jgi:2-keto-4-pentenoate hydratase